MKSRTYRNRSAYSRAYWEKNKARLQVGKMSKYTQPRYLAFHAWIDFFKAASPCADCGNCFPAPAMDFDHVRGEKLMEVGGMWSWSRAKVLAEIAKCDLVCACCHRLRTEGRRTQKAA